MKKIVLKKTPLWKKYQEQLKRSKAVLALLPPEVRGKLLSLPRQNYRESFGMLSKAPFFVLCDLIRDAYNAQEAAKLEIQEELEP
jgi:hypothetical protein